MNKIDNIERLLTDSAKDKINQIIADKKQELLEKAFDIARQNQIENIEISLRDILEANDNDKYNEIKYKNAATKKKRMATIFALAGSVYAIIGFVFFFYQSSEFDLKSNMGLIMVLLGVLLIIMSLFYSQLTTLKQTKTISEVNTKNQEYFPSLDYAIVERWQIIENLVRKKYEQKGTQDKNISFNQLLKYLSDNYSTTENEYNEIKTLLSARNDIVHNSSNYSDSKRVELINIADKIIDKLEKK